jgi:hypothetical protein
MIKHLRSVHKMPEGATPEECPFEGCMDSITVLFTSKLEVDGHVGAMHKTLNSTKPALTANIGSPTHTQSKLRKHSMSSQSDSRSKRGKPSTDPRSDGEGDTEVEVQNVKTLEILNMVRLNDFETWYKDEQKRFNIKYDPTNHTVKIRGSSDVIQDAKAKLEGWMKTIKDQISVKNCPSVSSKYNRSTAYSSSFKSGLSASQTDKQVENPIFPISAEDDKDALETWFLLLPKLSSVLGPALGKDYSAALVRQNSPDGLVPVIRIQSASGQSTAMRNRLREQIDKICSLHDRQSLQLQFSRGIPRRLVRQGNCPVVDDEANENRIFPHHRRYWHNPGMGASIGLKNCNDISATLGGYILVDGVIFILTVDHFFDDAETRTVVSPSMMDVTELQRDVDQTIRDIVAEIDNILTVDYTDGIPLTDIVGLYRDDLKRFQKYRKESARQPNDFNLGSLGKRCVQLAKIACTNHIRPAPKEALKHRMDWSIFEVIENRKGVNKHRCPPDYYKTGNWDDLSEDLNPLGVEPLCQTPCELEPNMPVQYVGQGSGAQFGHISAAPVSVTLNEETSSEWAIILQPGSQQIFTTYFGDSGSWVLRQSDNALVGLLWGWVDGHLLFTPIKDVFNDIQSVLNVGEIRLPSAPDSPHSNALLRSRLKASNESSQKPKTFFRRHLPAISKKLPTKVPSGEQPQTPDPVRATTDTKRSQPSDSPAPESYYSVPSPGSSASVSSPPELSTSSPSSPALSPREQHEFDGPHPSILNSDYEDSENEMRSLESKAAVEKLPDNKRVTETIAKTSLDFILQQC